MKAKPMFNLPNLSYGKNEADMSAQSLTNFSRIGGPTNFNFSPKTNYWPWLIGGGLVLFLLLKAK